MGKLKQIIAKPIIHILINRLDNNTQENIKMDILKKIPDNVYTTDSIVKRIDVCLPYRNILYWRISNERKMSLILGLKVLKRIYKPLDSIEIYVKSGQLGAGFSIPHNYCVINAEKIGQNVSVLQGVTIGKDNHGKTPTIGNNVVIYPNAVVVGDINIGDNVVIGANSFVNYDVPSNSTVRSAKSTYTEYKH